MNTALADDCNLLQPTEPIMSALALTNERLALVAKTEFIDFAHEVSLFGNEPGAIEHAALGNQKIGPLINSTRAIENAIGDILRWQDRGIGTICIAESGYPALLKQIADPPLVLFYQGELKERLAQQSCLSIVGSRRSDKVTEEVAFQFAENLCRAGLTIVSGLALGIDGAAHRGALSAAGPLPTVAVLGNGLPRIYPSTHQRLAAQILEANGVILSQFEPGSPPLRHNFINRNRVVAGLAHGTLVVQASAQSGSLTTARFALEFGREVMVIPGSILDPRFEGSNRIIKMGAYLVTEVSDVLLFYPDFKPIGRLKAAESKSTLTDTEQSLLKLISAQHQIQVEDLRALYQGDDFDLTLMNLELGGLVLHLPGNQVALKPKI